ncbi:UNVERIFIED_CONTAM: hypothetical protein HDU68_008510 [Siphonaria sp. JEL0065]|nr:hypothetical protein HDU68_008510 [Siphonaria sp. JEL0065]
MNVVELEDEPISPRRTFQQLSPVFSNTKVGASREASTSPSKRPVVDSRDYISADASTARPSSSDDFHSLKRRRSASPGGPEFDPRRRLSRSPPPHAYDDNVDDHRGRSPRLNERRSLSRENSQSPRRQPYQNKHRSPPRRRSSHDHDVDRQERPRGREFAGQDGGAYRERRRISPSERPTPKPSKTLGVFGLSILTHERDLEALFRPFGRIETISVLKDKITGKSRGYGFITYDEVESATKAIAAMNGTIFNDRQMRVDYTLSSKRVESPSRDGRDSRRRGTSPYSRSGHLGLPAVPLHYPGVPVGAPGAPGFPYPMPYGYYPYPYGYPGFPNPADPTTAGAGGEGKDGARSKETGEISPPSLATPVLYYDPRNPNPIGALPSGGAPGHPGAAPFPFGIPPGYPAPFMFDPRAMSGRGGRRDSSRERFRGAGRRDRSREDDRRRRGGSPEGRRDYNRVDRGVDRGVDRVAGDYARRSRDRSDDRK